ncbi:MAG TPA: small ribosomal subunit Rsm22 family protein [Nitrospirota bacterium]
MGGRKTFSQSEVRTLAADVLRLSRVLTTGRDELPAAYLRDEGLRKAYTAYFLPANLFKIHKPLHELALHPRDILSKQKLRVLDIGAGPGTASLGALEFLARRYPRTRLELVAVDQVAANLKEAEALFQEQQAGLDASLVTVCSDVTALERKVRGTFDVIIFANVLNELFAHHAEGGAHRTALASGLLEHLLAPDGSCIIIEPALRETSRDLLEVRDGMVGQGFSVYSPCLTNAPCPARSNAKDWCHEDIPWEPPALVREIDALTGLRKDSLKFSYLVLRKDRLSLADVCGTNACRVVSEPLVSKGKIEFYVCGANGRKLLMRLDRDAAPLNRDYEKLERGSLVSFERLTDEEKRYKVGKETAVSLFAVREEAS